MATPSRRVVVLRGHSVNPWELRSWERLGPGYDVAVLVSEGNLHAADVEKCMIDFAKTLTYPKSPSGKDTRFTYPFDFKAK